MADTDSIPEYLTNTSSKNGYLLVLVLIALGCIGFGFFQLSSTQQKEASSPQVSPFAPVKKIQVDVSGAVESPGLFTFESRFDETIRIGTVLEKAGGLSGDADRAYVSKHINLAKGVEDGEKIYIPKLGEQAVLGIVDPVSQGKISLGSASIQELESLPGIGPTRAQKIIDSRPYNSMEEVYEKTGISKTIFDKIEGDISL